MLIFKNLPDTTTPINAENLNTNFSGLDENKAVASIRVSTQESGNQWKKIAVMTFGGTDTYRIIGTSNVSGVNGRGHFELLISGENSNSASASLVSATNGINSSMFRVFASTDYKTITVYFESPQWTAYRVNAYLTRVYEGGNDSCTLYNTKETPSGDVEIPVIDKINNKYAQYQCYGKTMTWNTAWTNQIIPFNNAVVTSSDFRLNSDGTIQYLGQSAKVLVDVSFNWYNNELAGDTAVRIYVNNVSIADLSYVYYSSDNNFCSLNGKIVLDLNNNDGITIVCSKGAVGTCHLFSSTRIYLEVLD